MINKLKAGEVVERPASIVKELIENSIDAYAENIILEISNWWKSMIKVEDDWTGIPSNQLQTSIDSFTTSKIQSDEDLYNISSYWFRWEALSTISQVSKFTIQTKSKQDKIAYQLQKIDNRVSIEEIPFHKNHWTIVIAQDLFFNVPARQKFLKSDTTEYNYILDVFLDFALVNHDKNFKLIKHWKTIKNFIKTQDQYSRIIQIYKESREPNLKILQNSNEKINIFWIVSDSNLTFGSQNNIKIFVNQRPIEDKIIKKALMDFYKWQIPPGQYPLAVLFLKIDPGLLDINVHPRKKEVKFLDPNSIFNFVQQSLTQTFSSEKVSSWKFVQKDFSNQQKNISKQWQYKILQKSWEQQSLDLQHASNIYWKSNFSQAQENTIIDNYLEEFEVIGQVWNSFIILQGQQELYFVDQHALAERISFEKMKKDLEKNKLQPEIILNPISLKISWNIDIQPKIDELSKLWFDISFIWENTIAVYAIPNVFVKYNIDIEKILDNILNMEDINLDWIMDDIFANKACKTSIKAWDKLSIQEMVNLIKEGYKHIDKMFVCQHWRPSIVKITKSDIQKLFIR